MPRTRRALVAGATGYLGGHVVRAFHAAGWSVAALARRPERLDPELRALCDEVVVAEATRPETLDGCCAGADVVFSSIGISHARRRPTIWDVDQRANQNLVREAARAGAGRFVFISVIHAERVRGWLEVAEARERVVDDLAASGMPYTVLRPTSFFVDMERALEGVRRLGVMPLPGRRDARINPIHGADLADEVVRVASDPAAVGLARAVGGPQVLTLGEVAELLFAALGRRPRVVSLPAGLVRGAARLVAPFNVNAATFAKLMTVADLHDAVGAPVGHRRLQPFLTTLASRPG